MFVKNLGIDFSTIHKIEILSTDDAKIKTFGELISNDSSRTIFNMIFDHEMTALEIANKAGMSLELVRYHVQKMLEVGIVDVSKIGKTTREQEMKYYRVAKIIVIVLPQQLSEKARKSKSLMSSLSKIYRIAAIGTAGLVSWMLSKIILGSTESVTSEGSEIQGIPETTFLPITISLAVIIVGLIIERILKSRYLRE